MKRRKKICWTIIWLVKSVLKIQKTSFKPCVCMSVESIFFGTTKIFLCATFIQYKIGIYFGFKYYFGSNFWSVIFIYTRQIITAPLINTAQLFAEQLLFSVYTLKLKEWKQNFQRFSSQKYQKEERKTFQDRILV